MPSAVPHYSLAWSLLLLLADVIAWHLLADRNRMLRIAIRLLGFVAYSLVVINSGVSPLEAPAWPDNSAMQFAATALAIVWWMYAARTLTVLLGLLLTGRVGHSGRLLQEVIGAVIFLIAIVAAAGYVLQLPVKGLLATSGAMAIIVGLALQSTLSDVFSGIILNTTKPYQVDDSISIDGMEGKVMDIDWRATHLLTGVGTMVVIPNSVAAKAKIVNLSRPAHIHGVSINVMMSPHIRPRRVLDALERALQGCSALLQTPKPRAVVKETSPTTIEYSMTGFIGDLSTKSDVRNLLFDLAYRHLEAAGITWQSDTTADDVSRPRALLDEVKVFRTSTVEEKDQLAQAMVSREYAAGQTIMERGEISDGLLVIATGVVSANILDGTTLIEAGRMGPGEVMGEQGVLADAPSEGRFVALTSCVIYRIDKAATRRAMEQRAEITTALNKLQAIRQQSSQHILLRKPVAIKKNNFLGWLQKR
ncbi:mechanosensitive ion channel family protein [Pseudomonas sp. GD03842]|uniref:mechanosensitive ion channel family protein n=1 Tax=unclassified Pseudomonas TaxID=196821 RepID=UPI000D3354AD|nr:MULTISPECIES: mechanosensitive ion channel family protein [unclassified Pseudomonas]MDH0744868.1 mechanosensitive ion channel family protein [Pseudomonas sp. GD03842]RAU45403.1 mechanosensitive ion channel protein MscS [Pseudomonas sp. RIT 409]RAU53213.1 mechanosensitive ion channel protein MscS [Pseudomonas sp. RIT 412]